MLYLVLLNTTIYNFDNMKLTKIKTQITLNSRLASIVSVVMERFPTYDVNKSIEFLLACGSKSYLDEVGLTYQDLLDIEISRTEIESSKSEKAANMTEAIKKLKK